MESGDYVDSDLVEFRCLDLTLVEEGKEQRLADQGQVEQWVAADNWSTQSRTIGIRDER